MEGWIKLHRKIQEWQWFHSPNHFKLWNVLILRANHKETKHRLEAIKPGQLLTGRTQLAQWSGFSEQSVRTMLQDFKRTSEITIKSTKKYSIITILNWNEYQAINQEINQQLTNNQPTTNQQLTTSKNANNNNNENNEENIILGPKKILPIVEHVEILKTPSPLSVFFTHMPEVQLWLDSGTHDTHQLIINKYSKQIIEVEVLDMYVWAMRNNVKAEAWMYKRLLSKNINPKGYNQAQKAFKSKTNGLTPTPSNPTGDPYLQEAIDRGLVG